MASADESYRAWWFLSCKSCHPALAAPVGQIPLGKVRLMKPTALTATSVIGISMNALRKKHLNNCGASASRSPMRTEPRPIRYDASASWGTIRREAPTPNRPGHFGTRVKARNLLRIPAPKHQPLQRQTSKRPARFNFPNQKHASPKPSAQTTKGKHRVH